METKEFDLTEYLELHYEIVQAITIEWMKDEPTGRVEQVQAESGHGGLYELAKELTDKFYNLHKDTEWGYELGWLETIEEFLEKELY